ncbi:MAG: hypothetical protein J7L89_03155 [Bacteroidales bacterium]|nr:hypothetical protein [Bacteroidales bacterium]
MRKYLISLLLLLLWVLALRSQENSLLSSWPRYLDMKAQTPFDLEWISVGPVMNSARVEAVQGDPVHPGTWYVAFGSGNLWKTTDHGLTWVPIFEDQPALGIGDITLAPSNPDIIYVGTGESLKKPRNFTLPGVGVFRSDDGGSTWRHIGLEQSRQIGEIAVDPQNPDIVFVAVLGHFWSPNPDRGLYRSMDGGKSWEQVLFLNDHTGANDVVIAPSDPNVVYASMWENYPGVSGKNSGVYRSRDGGTTWERCTGGLPDGDHTGRIGLAVSWQNPDKAYALIDNLNRKPNLAAEYYQTLDGGVTWKRTHEKDLLIFPGIGWYFADTYVNPQNDDEVYLLGVRIAHSTDGGKTFDLTAGKVHHLNPNPAIPLHLDHCEMWINPDHPGQLLLGNDGGFYVSYNRGGSWMHYNNLPTGEFYDISVDRQTPYRIYGGTQDDASVYGLSKEWDPRYADGWKYIWVDAWSGGDGCVTIPDPFIPDLVYTSSQNGGIFKMDLAAGRQKGIHPRLPRGIRGKLQYNFVAPYILSTHYTVDPSGGDSIVTIYQSGNYVFKSKDRGDHWTLISPDLSNSSVPSKKSLAAGAIAESPLEPGHLYVGTDHGAFWVTADDGDHWTEHSEGLPDAYIRSISPSHSKSGRVYITLTGINYDDLNRYIYVSDDDGLHWTDIGANLPNEVANVILEDPQHDSVLFAGTMRGVYLSYNRGKSWYILGYGMAATCISDLEIQAPTRDLVAGTHGRGIYKLNLKPVDEWLHYLASVPATASTLNPPPLLFSIPPLRAPWYNATHGDPDPRTIEKTAFTFWLDQNQEVTLRIFDKNKEIYTKDIYGFAGFNQYRWDGVIKKTSSNQPYFFHYKTYLSPGKYRVDIIGERMELSGELVVRKGEKE